MFKREKRNPLSMSLGEQARALADRWWNAPKENPGDIWVEGDERFLGIPINPLKHRTVDRFARTQAPTIFESWQAEAEAWAEEYPIVVAQVAAEIEQERDRELWNINYPDKSVAQVIMETANYGGTKVIKDWKRMDVEKIWDDPGAKIELGEVPLAISVEGYPDIGARLTGGAIIDGKPILVIGNDPRALTSFRHAFDVAAARQSHQTYNFIITDNPDSLWGRTSNVLPMEASETGDILHYLNGAIEGKPKWRQKNIVYVENIAAIKSEVLLHKLNHVAVAGKSQGRVGMIATIGLSEFAGWMADDGSPLQKTLVRNFDLVFTALPDNAPRFLLASVMQRELLHLNVPRFTEAMGLLKENGQVGYLDKYGEMVPCLLFA